MTPDEATWGHVDAADLDAYRNGYARGLVDGVEMGRRQWRLIALVLAGLLAVAVLWAAS